MTIEAQLLQSLQLLGLGMGTVFGILILLIGLISLVSRLTPDEAPPTTTRADTSPAGASGIDPGHLAAIAAAVHAYRKRR